MEEKVMSQLGCICGERMTKTRCPSPCSLDIFYKAEVDKAIYEDPSIALHSFLSGWDERNDCTKEYMDRPEPVDYWYCPACKRVYEVQYIPSGRWLRIYKKADIPVADSFESWTQIYVLPDVTKELTPAVYDPVGFVSAWKGGGFINLHLLPKTKANLNNHVWGFIRDNQRTNSAGGTTYELSLYHDQKADPLAYSNDLYLSLAIDSVSKSFGTQDSIELKVQGFDQQRILKYGK